MGEENSCKPSHIIMKLINNAHVNPRHMVGSKAAAVLFKAAAIKVLTCHCLHYEKQTATSEFKLAGKSSIFHVKIGAKVDPVMSW